MDSENTGRRQVAWSVCQASVEGASHRRSGTPNQDAIGSTEASNRSAGLVLALADGHGSPHCFRSEVGAQLGIEVALGLLGGFLAKSAQLGRGEINRLAQTELPGELVMHWMFKVGQHRKANPFTEDEAHLLRSKRPGGDPAAPVSNATAALAYGATLMAVAVGDGFAVFFQLGDGDILLVPDAPGSVAPAMPPDAQLIANETTSLCLPNAEKLFRYRFLDFDEVPPPRLILASTDGYPNCFETEADFHKVGTDIRDAIVQEGLAQVGAELAGWLRQASDEGSGDDATIGLVWRKDGAAAAPAVPVGEPT